MIKYTISALKKDGTRQRALNNNHLNNFDTREEAERLLAAILKENSWKDIEQTMGTDLRVDPVDCWDNGDAKGIYFDN